MGKNQHKENAQDLWVYFTKMCEKPTPLGVGWIALNPENILKIVYKTPDNIHKI